ncbi:helix-turn-helix domain-containing protein [Streptomyces sp. NPDC004579]|uniref:helix-turn-helix domain-containing protein n=1 Tax=Streptomyces sp. NPDC004579 TaxID=3154667 RepID=UPI0033A635E4
MAAADDDVTRFAELLARLKARTDRSYAALARRLNMNASTLHRYCAGEAVPLDFAVVERFAALCGASTQERVELHRLWILAVAERRRSRPTAALSTPPASPGPLASSAPDPHPTRDGSDRSHEPDGSRRSHGPDGPDEPHRPNGSRRSDGSDGSKTPPAPDVTSGTPGSGEPSSRSWYRRRRPVVVSAVLGGVFLLTAAGFAAFNAFPGFPAHGSPGGDTTPRGGPAASTAEASAGPSAQALPFTWTVNSHVWEEDCGHDYVIAKPPAQVPPPPPAEDAEVWADAQDAVHGGETIVRVSVRGRSSAAVVLEALHVRVVRRAAPPGDGAFVYDTDLGCAGGVKPSSFAVNLDAHTPVPRAVAGSKGDVTLPARRLPYRVSVEDPEVLLVKAGTEHCACDWYLDLDWSSQGTTGTIRIDDHGRPFRTSGIAGLPLYRYADSPGRWIQEPARH